MFVTRCPMPVTAGDLIFCPEEGRAGFVKRSAQAGEEVVVVDEGRFSLALAPHPAEQRPPAVGDRVYISDTGAPSTLASTRPVGVITGTGQIDEQHLVTVELNA